MASELSESSGSSEIPTPTISVDEQHDRPAVTTKQGLDDNAMPVQDDMALGLDLMMKEMQFQSVREPGEKANPRHETVLKMIGKHLDSEICTISVGKEEMNLHAHRAVLEQSPVFAILLKHKQEASQTLCIKFPHQSPPLVCAIVQYLYGCLPIFDTAHTVQELCEAYTAAGDLELDLLQDNIIDSLDLKEDIDDTSEGFLYAAQQVYKKCAARLPFRDLFKRNIKKTIHKWGLDESSYLCCALKTLVPAGGELAVDIVQALMEVHTEKMDIFEGRLDNIKARYAESEVAKLLAANNVLRAKIDAADVQYKDLGKDFMSAQKQAESELEHLTTMVIAAHHEQGNAEIALENQRAKAQSAEARLHELSEHVVAAEQQLESLKKASSGKQAVSNTTDQDKNWEGQAMRMTGLQMSGTRNFQGGGNRMEDEGLVAIASTNRNPQLPSGLAFNKGDRITNIDVLDNKWFGSCHGKRGYFRLDFVENPDALVAQLRL